MDREALAVLPSAVLTDMVEQVYALICALTALLVRLLDVCGERGVHLEDHVPSIEDWTRMRLGVRKNTVREYVRMGRALADLPKTSEALSNGELSIDQTGSSS